ncbi:MAG: transposase DNA-binding-containing protein [Rhodocyclaceae bacterium]
MSRPEGEFRDIALGDKRLNEGAALLAGQLAAKPSGIFPGARGGSAASQAADRFFARPEFGWEAFLSPFGAMPKRMRAHAGRAMSMARQ